MLQPLQDWILIKVIEPEKKTEMGLIIPDSVFQDQQLMEGEVVAAGPDIDISSMQANDRVFYQKDFAIPIKYSKDKDKFVLIKEERVVAQIRD